MTYGESIKTYTVGDRMSVDPVTVAPKDLLQRVVELLRRRDIRAVPVVEDGKLTGIVTDRDVGQVAPLIRCFVMKTRSAATLRISRSRRR